MHISKSLTAIMIALSVSLPLQGCAQETAQSEEQLVAELRTEVAALFTSFSPVPFRTMRKAELDETLTGAGYTGQELGREHFYSKRVPSEGGGRPPQYHVIATFCSTSGDNDPMVSKVVVNFGGLQGDDPRDFIDQVQAGSVLPRVAQVLEDSGSSFVSFQAQFLPSEQGEISLGAGEAQASGSGEASQKITLVMQVNCPAN